MSTTSNSQLAQAFTKPKHVAVRLPKLPGLCSCGREREPRHCPGCGRKSLYGIQRADEVVKIPVDILDTVRKATGEPEATHIIAYGYFCRLCRVDFNDLDTCEAPKPNLYKSMKERRRVDKAIDLSATVAAYGEPDSAEPEPIRVDKLRAAFVKAGLIPE